MIYQEPAQRVFFIVFQSPKRLEGKLSKLEASLQIA